ncbi:helix-turn-helix transcriptional regulator [Oceanobacter kriegii]|uniref:helix-turn-helix transcriptional regulator n=1 Tax=Oceanobacter kriegii TaxID=64972 RepID=UPI00040A04B6|nr:WYL domain-containing protein [Oceanobacter kriegii]
MQLDSENFLVETQLSKNKAHHEFGTLLRLIVMLRLIPEYLGKIRTQTLHEKLTEQGYPVSERTIQRDLKRILDAVFLGLDQDTENKPFGWYMAAGHSKKSPVFDNKTALAWALSSDTLAKLLRAQYSQLLKKYFVSANQQLDFQKGNLFHLWKEKVCHIPNRIQYKDPIIDSKVWGAITTCLLEQKKINVEYKCRGSEQPKKIDLHPLGLIVRNNSTCLVARAREYDYINCYALKRFHYVEVTSERATVPNNFSLDQYIASGNAGWGRKGKHIALKARISSSIANHLNETPVGKIQKNSDILDADWKELTASIPDNQESLWWVFSLNSQIEVVEPLEWRNAIIESSMRIQNICGSGHE